MANGDLVKPAAAAGNGNKGQEMKPISESRRKRVETGLMAVQEVEQERDDFKRLLDEEILRRKGCETELEGLRANYDRVMIELEAYRRERDWAVAQRAKVEATFDAVRVIMNNHASATVIDETESRGAGSDQPGVSQEGTDKTQG